MKWRGWILGVFAAFAALTVSAAERPTVDVLMIGHFSSREGEAPLDKLRADFAKDGVNFYINEKGYGSDYTTYTPEFLRKFHVVIFGGDPAKDTNIAQKPEKTKVFLDNLDAFYREGGGILWIPMSFHHWGKTWNDSVGKRYDAQSLEEDLYDKPENDITLNPKARLNFIHYFYTDDIVPSPVTEGVRGLLLPRVGEWSWPGTVPMKFGPSWKVLVRGAKTTSTVGNLEKFGSGNAKFSPEKPGTYAASPEIVGLREPTGGAKGRMMVFPFYSSHTFLNYGSPVFNDAFMKNGVPGKPSDGYRLLVNAFHYLGAPAQAAKLGGFVSSRKARVEMLAPYDWARTRFPQGSWSGYSYHKKAFRGIFGAQTALSGGKGTVADWVKAAKEQNLQFLFFLEDITKLDQAKLDELVKQCKENSTEDFLCSPGFRGIDTLGNALFMSEVSKMPEEKNMKDGRIRSFGDIVNQHAWKNFFGLYRLSSMPLDPQFFFLTSIAAPYTYENGKLVDDGVKRYFDVEGTGHNYAPVSVVEIADPALLAETLKTAHVTILYGQKVAEAARKELERSLRHPAGVYVTNGPAIDFWGLHNSGGNVFRPGANNFRAELAASSPAGIREVLLVEADTGKVFRRFLPNGAKEFRCTIDDTITTQRMIAPKITDMNGRTAVAQPMLVLQNSNRLWMMSDRLMGMHHSHIWDAEHKQLIQTSGNLGQGITWIKQNHNSAGYAPTIRASERRNVVLGVDGGKMYPAGCSVDPAVSAVEGREPSANAYRFRNTLSSADQAIMDYDGNLQFVKRPEQEGLAWCVYPETKPLQLAEINARTWAVRPRLETVANLNVHEVTVVFKKDLTLRDIQLSYVRRWDKSHDCVFSLRDTTGRFSETMPLDSKWNRSGTLPQGGYLYPAGEIAGAVGFINIGAQPINYSADVNGARIFLNANKRAVKAGEKMVFRWMNFFMDFPQPPAEALEKIIADYGLGGEKPGYTFNVTQGKLQSTVFEMVLDAENAGAAVEVKKYDLPNNLPLRVQGIAANAVAGRYDLDRKQLLILAPFEGGVRTAINTKLGDTRLYVGELVRVSNPAIITSAVQDKADHVMIELHNPTDKPLDVKLDGLPAFAPLADWHGTITIPAGSSVKLGKNTPAGSLRFTPYEGDI